MTVSTEDLAFIKNHGVPADPSPEFLTIAADGGLTFTPRGRQVYRLALLLHGLGPEQVAAVRDREGLRVLSLKVKQVRVIVESDEAERALNSGAIAVKSRAMMHAALHGTPEDLQRAVEQRLACEAAGENVIPAAFGSRRK